MGRFTLLADISETLRTSHFLRQLCSGNNSTRPMPPAQKLNSCLVEICQYYYGVEEFIRYARSPGGLSSMNGQTLSMTLAKA